MNYGERISDKFAQFNYQHHFEGFLLNRIPLMNKLKWRLVGTSNVVFGSMSQRNQRLYADTIGTLNPRKPYIELGYGVENIFKFIRVDFIHRMSYLGTTADGDKPRKFGVFISFQFSL